MGRGRVDIGTSLDVATALQISATMFDQIWLPRTVSAFTLLAAFVTETRKKVDCHFLYNWSSTL